MKIGDNVRSFDFAETFDDGEQFGRDIAGERACYVEGTIVAIERHPDFGYDCYEIAVHRDVFAGKETARRIGKSVFPPVNGTPTMLSRQSDGVEGV